VQLDSRPAPIDAIERRLLQLRIESEALKGDELPATARRLTQLNEEVANLEEELASLMLQYQSEKKQSDELAALRVELEHKKWEVEKMEARYNLQVHDACFGQLIVMTPK
jgi:ATP-dependent Clp protease ATP-binding subunit ClpB